MEATTVKPSVQNKERREFEILNQLISRPMTSTMPPADLLNAPENAQLKSFFLTPVKDPQRLAGKKIAVLVADGFEEIELTGPVWYFKELGATVEIVGPSGEPVPSRFALTVPAMAKDHVMAIQYLTPVGWTKLDHRVTDITVDDYDAIFIPGGSWNPDNLRADKHVIKFVQDFFASGKLVAAICHAPVVLITADLLKGKKLTGYWNIQIDLKNAGGIVSDEPLVVDGNLITSRHPIDIHEFATGVADWLSKH